MAGGLVTFGETMALLTNARLGRLRHAESLMLGFAGAESNVAIGVSRLGGKATWIGRVGDDELGELIVSGIRGEGVDVTGARRDGRAPTSLMIKERLTGDLTRVGYYRRHGPGSLLEPADVDPAVVTTAAVLHVTGITPALSESARKAVHTALATAREAGVVTSLDYNYRAALWSTEAAASELRDLTTRVDIVFAGEDEAALLVDAPQPHAQAVAIAALGPERVVIKRGAAGAVASVAGRILDVPAIPVVSVDPVGAGDAFVAGYLAELMAGGDDATCLDTATVCGAFAVTVPGDWEGMPFRTDLSHLRRSSGTVLR